LSDSNRNVFYQVNQLRYQNKNKDALKLLNKLESSEEFNLEEQCECNFLKSIILTELGKYREALKYNDLALLESRQLEDNFKIIDVLIEKVFLVGMQDRKDESLEIITETEQMLEATKHENSDEFKDKKVKLEFLKIRHYLSIGDYEHSLNLAQKSLITAEEENDRERMMLRVKLIAFNYSLLGETNKCYEYIRRYLSLAEELNNKQEVIGALNSLAMNLMDKGEFFEAIGHAERGLTICDEISSWKTAAVLTTLFDLYIYTNSYNKAEECFDRVGQILNQEYNRWYDEWYHCQKAVLLKSKPQEQDYEEALKIFKRIINQENISLDITYHALINLCDLYLKELNEKNDLKILDEMQPYLSQLERIAKTYKSFWIEVETYSLQSKLNLITFKFKEAQDLLVKAYNVAEKHGLHRLIKQILHEQSELSNNFRKWEKLKESNARISDRMHLANIEEQIILLLQKRRYLKSIEE
jgi:tetratricopeptide (TPR) repeat protein